MWRQALLALLAWLIGCPATQAQIEANEIGSWVLICSTTCQLRHRSWLVPPLSAVPSIALEVVHRGAFFVPVVAVRGLPMQLASAAVIATQATVRFDNGPQRQLHCALDDGAIICRPASDLAAVAAELAASRKVLIRMAVSLPGVAPIPLQSRSLDLLRTADALARFRATAPPSEPVPVVSGHDWHDYLDRLRKTITGLEDPHE